MTPIFSDAVLDNLRTTLYGTGATLAFFRLGVDSSPALLATLAAGFTIYGLPKADNADHEQRYKAIIGPTVYNANRANLHSASTVRFTSQSFTWELDVEELLPTQQLGGGAILHLKTIKPVTVSA